MTNIILTQYSGKIVGPIAVLIGYIVDFIYNLMDSMFGVQNIGLVIFILTFVVYMLLLPLTYKQQKFSKMSMRMNPELKALQEKYKNRTDQESRLQYQEETRQIYDKYGVSPSGSCVQLFIQMPIFFALYRVIYNVPAYVGSVKATYETLVSKIMAVEGYQDILTSIADKVKLTGVKLNFAADATQSEISNSIIDVLYQFPTHSWADLSGWESLTENFPNLADLIETTKDAAFHFNYFFGLDIANSPWETMKSTFSAGQYGIMILAILVPILSGLTQYINLKLSMAGAPAQDKNNPMASSMNSMNLMMPLISVIFVLTLPTGLGIYWIAGAIVRTFQQIIINKRLDKIDFDEVLEKNREKAEKKREKREGYTAAMIAENGKLKTKNISTENKNEKLEQAEQYKQNAKPGSLASKANMVRDYNERNNK